jgi:DNA end-binding protein Ku
VTVTREELEAFTPKATRSIDIEDFVDLHQIDPIYYDHSYYLVPDRGAARPYALLLEAMKRTGRVGIGQFVLRTKQYLAAVRPMGKALALSTMLHADEVVDQTELEGLPSAEAKPREKELQMAEQLVQSLATDFDPKKYKDTFREQVVQLLERKAEGQEIVAEPAEEEPRGKVVNLMDALAKSLAAARKGEAPQAGERRHRPEGERAAARTTRAPARHRKTATKGRR